MMDYALEIDITVSMCKRMFYTESLQSLAPNYTAFLAIFLYKFVVFVYCTPHVYTNTIIFFMHLMLQQAILSSNFIKLLIRSRFVSNLQFFTYRVAIKYFYSIYLSSIFSNSTVFMNYAPVIVLYILELQFQYYELNFQSSGTPPPCQAL
jgi:hypothetical protein